jgi:hypothetical protein
MSLTISLHRIGVTNRVDGRHHAAKPHLPLLPHERVLGRCESSAEAAVATDRALMLGTDNGTWRRIAWTAVASAGWSPSDDCLTLRLWPSDNDRPAPLRVAADERLAAIVSERVEAQRLLCVPIELQNGITGHVLALRDGDDVQWRVLTSASLDAPSLQRACALAITEIRSLAGI